MVRIPPLNESQWPDDSREILQRHVAGGGRVTNMKRTLSHSPLALRILMEWYPLRDSVVAFLGERATLLFVHAISDQSDCLICSTFFRRILIERGEHPDHLELDSWEQMIVEYGRQLVRDSNSVSDRQFEALASRLAVEQIICLTTFGGLMIATNLFNNALRVELDQYLWSYQKDAAAGIHNLDHQREPDGDR